MVRGAYVGLASQGQDNIGLNTRKSAGSDMDYKVRLVEDEAGFEVLESRWADLLARAADPNTFLGHDWLYCWWASYRPRARLCLVLAERGERLMGIAPLMRTRGTRSYLPLRALQFVGDGTSETDHMNFVVDAAERGPVMTVLLAAIDRLRWDLLMLNQIPGEASNTGAVVDFARSRGWLITSREVPCPACKLPDDYESLLRSMPGRFRTALRSTRRKLDARGDVSFGLHSTPEEIPAALDTLFSNHGDRWKLKGQAGVFVDPRKRVFYANLSARLLRNGALRFYYLKVGSCIVAQQYCFAHGSTVMLLQEGFDPEFAHLNVGNALRSMVFERLISEGVGKYDFLAGLSRHKQNWANVFPVDLRLELARTTIRGRLAHAAPRVISRIRKALSASAGGSGANAGTDETKSDA